MLPVEYIAAVLSKVDLVELIGQAVPLKKAGKEYKGLCPFHNERTPSFMVSPQKQLFHCFGCGAAGDAATWMEKFEGKPFREGLRVLAERVGMPPPPEKQEDLARLEQLKPVQEAMDLAHAFYREQLKSNPEVLAYLETRGVTRSMADRFGLGYAPARYQIPGIKASIALSAGIARQNDQGRTSWLLRNRVIFPIRNSSRQVIAFGARLLSGDGPKYLNTGESPLYTKGNHLYGIGDIAASASTVCLHEGYMDSLVCNIHGIPSLAVCGSALTPAQADTLLARHTEIVLMFDPDEAGRKATINAIEVLLPKVRPRHTIRVATLPEGMDPDEFVIGGGAEAMESLRDGSPTASHWILSRMENLSVEESAKYRDWVKTIAAGLTGSYGEAFVAEMEKRGMQMRVARTRDAAAPRPSYHRLTPAMRMTAVLLDRPDFARSSSFSPQLMPEPARTLSRVMRRKPEVNAASIMAMLTPAWQKGIAPAVEVQLPDLTDLDVRAVYLEAAVEEATRIYLETRSEDSRQLIEVLRERLDALEDEEGDGEIDDLMPSINSGESESRDEEEDIPLD